MTTLDKPSPNGIAAIYISESRSEMGARTASDIAHEISTCLQKQSGLRMIFAAAPSQSEMLSALLEEKDIDWLDSLRRMGDITRLRRSNSPLLGAPSI